MTARLKTTRAKKDALDSKMNEASKIRGGCSDKSKGAKPGSKKKFTKEPLRDGTLQSTRAQSGSEKKKKAAPKKEPKNAEEAFMLAWEKTYANRHKRFKLGEGR